MTKKNDPGVALVVTNFLDRHSWASSKTSLDAKRTITGELLLKNDGIMQTQYRSVNQGHMF
jgi:hypothetical protein